jgi:aspartate racemase
MLGILGGMGPMATVDFMAKVIRNTSATCDQEHLQMLVSSDTEIPDRTAALLDGGADPFPAMRNALRWLEAGGARFIAIPCNTAHYWHRSLQDETAVPILHIVDAVANQSATPGQMSGPVGILATTGTVRAGIYQERLAHHGMTCRIPDGADQTLVMDAIRWVKAGDVASARSILSRQARNLLDAGCNHVVMACTEIPLALAGSEIGLSARLIDPTEALARECIAVSIVNRASFA